MASQSSPPPPLSSDSRPTPFLTKTYQLVDDVSLDPIISWTQNGTAFVICDPAEFARLVLPNHFKHNNFSSFLRQLNIYGFRKITPDRWEFAHVCFRRGEKRLLGDIVRRKVIHTTADVCGDSMPSSSLLFVDQGEHGGSSGSASGSRAHLLDENDRLKKKNTQLCKELTRMKSMCTSVYSIMSGYNPGSSGLVPGLGHGPGPPMLHNISQAESMMLPSRILEPVVEVPSEEDGIVDENLSSDPSRSKRDREEDSSAEPVNQNDLLQLQQPRGDRV